MRGRRKGRQRVTPLEWARPRRWSILGEAALAAVLALVAVPFAAFDGGEPEPVAVVTGYLEALREGDVERAETYVSHEYAQEADLSWLTAEALSPDWEIESVSLKSASDTTVHAVISADGRRAEGAFRLELLDEEYTIVNPYLYLSSASGRFRTLEINGERRDVERNADDVALSVALYPGAYALFASAPAVVGEGGVPLLAVPGSGADAYFGERVDVDQLLTAPLTEGDGVEAALNEALAAWIDDCAASGAIAPEGCPFSAAYDWGVAYDGHSEFTSVEELDWAVGAYPKVRFGPDLALVVVEPGWMALSGNGIALLDEEAALDGRCGVDVGNVAATIGGDGGLALALAYEQGNSCY